MKSFGPILAALTALVVYAWTLQAWPVGWMPALAYLIVLAGAAGVGGWYVREKASEAERAELLQVQALAPTAAAALLSTLALGAWMSPAVRAGAVGLVATQSSTAAETGLSDPSPQVRERSCLEMGERGYLKRSTMLGETFERHPGDAVRCVRTLRAHEVGGGRSLATRLTRRWHRRIMTASEDRSIEPACLRARAIQAMQSDAGLNVGSISPEVLECSLRALDGRMRACCTEALTDVGEVAEGLAPADLITRQVDPGLYVQMVRATYGAEDMSDQELEAASVLGLRERRWALIGLGCDLIERDGQATRAGLQGLVHIVSRAECAPGDEDAMLFLSDPGPWSASICPAVAEAEGARKEEQMCAIAEQLWEREAVIEASALVEAALQRAERERIARAVPRTRGVRGYGVAGSASQREKYSDKVGKYEREGGDPRDAPIMFHYRAAGYAEANPTCTPLDFGDDRVGAMLDQHGTGCIDPFSSLEDIDARQKAILDAIQGKGDKSLPGALGSSSSMKKKYGGVAYQKAMQDQREAYNEDAARRGMKKMGR